MRATGHFSMAALLAAACARTPQVVAPSSPPLDVRLDASEVDAALAILDARLRGAPPSATEWQRLFASAGYVHLKERETAMRRPFTDSSFAAFLMSDTLLARAPSLIRAVAPLERIDVSAAARRAFAYLPAGSAIRARMYLEIKPVTNTFVFRGNDSTPSIFVYVEPSATPAQLENTLAHELHHIGLSAACSTPAFPVATPAQRMLLTFLGGFGEGQAMLAAAGSPLVHPHATDADSIQERWDRDVANAPAHIRELSEFFTAVLDGRITSADSVRARAVTYYGVQGPWYTVGWLMASTIERLDGRAALIETLCEPTQFIAAYNAAAARVNGRGPPLPRWDPKLVRRLAELRRPAP